MDGALSAINEFLATLPNDEYLTLHLRDWLKSVPSIVEVWMYVFTLPALPRQLYSVTQIRLLMEDKTGIALQMINSSQPTVVTGLDGIGWLPGVLDLCFHLRKDNIHKVVFFINTFLATLPNDVCDAQDLRQDLENLQDLENWLTAMPCITEVDMFVLLSNPAQPKSVGFSFTENGVTQRVSLRFSTNPLRVHHSD